MLIEPCVRRGSFTDLRQAADRSFAAGRTSPAMTRRRLRCWPETDGPIAAAGCEQLPARSESDGRNAILVSYQPLAERAGSKLPHAYLVAAPLTLRAPDRARQESPVGGEGEGAHD